MKNFAGIIRPIKSIGSITSTTNSWSLGKGIRYRVSPSVKTAGYYTCNMDTKVGTLPDGWEISHIELKEHYNFGHIEIIQFGL